MVELKSMWHQSHAAAQLSFQEILRPHVSAQLQVDGVLSRINCVFCPRIYFDDILSLVNSYVVNVLVLSEICV